MFTTVINAPLETAQHAAVNIHVMVSDHAHRLFALYCVTGVKMIAALDIAVFIVALITTDVCMHNSCHCHHKLNRQCHHPCYHQRSSQN